LQANACVAARNETERHTSILKGFFTYITTNICKKHQIAAVWELTRPNFEKTSDTSRSVTFSLTKREKDQMRVARKITQSRMHWMRGRRKIGNNHDRSSPYDTVNSHSCEVYTARAHTPETAHEDAAIGRVLSIASPLVCQSDGPGFVRNKCNENQRRTESFE
jgi:hypothetical protein